MVTSGAKHAWKTALEAAFPVARDGALLAYTGLVTGPEGTRAGMRLTIKDGLEIVYELEQELVLDGVTPAEIAAWAVRARVRMVGLADASGCITPAALIVPPFLPLDAELVGPANGERAVEAVTDALREQALAGGFEHRFDRLAVWPAIPRTIYFLDLASAMLGGNGLEVYLSQQCFEDVLGVLEALEAVGCEGLALRMRQGITLAAEEGGAEFLMQVDDDWLEENGRPLDEDEDEDEGEDEDASEDDGASEDESAGEDEDANNPWRRIDSHEPGGTWWLVDNELRPALERYVRENLGALVA